VCFGLLLSIFVAHRAHAAKILGIFPLPVKSHFIVSSVLLKELANRGHQVTVFSPFPEKSPIPNYTNIDITLRRDELLNTTGTTDYVNKLHKT
jgi:glucuronosyltransferase